MDEPVSAILDRQAATRAVLLALNFTLLASPSYLAGSTYFATAASGAMPFLIATILLVVVNGGLIKYWSALSPNSQSAIRFQSAIRNPQSAIESPQSAMGNPQSAILNPQFAMVEGLFALLLCGVLIFLACRSWLHQILIFPHDAMRADMLVVIQQGIHRMLQGRNPYTMYKVPWDATLPYGPMMWAPFIVPYALHADVRFATILGELFVPAACAIAAVAAAAAGRRWSALAWMIVLAGFVTSPELRGFTSIGHTPTYWPLIAAFAWMVARRRWYAAALAAGLLIVARTTMASMAPVLVMAVWHRDRPRALPACLLLAIAVIAPFLPFALWDWPALKFALYGSYQSLIKGFVWTSTDWAHNTIGITGLLLRVGWHRMVEPVQGLVLLLVYVMSWRALGRGDEPLPWMAGALLAFSMTTLWPVHYIYLDVFVLIICAALADSSWLPLQSRSHAWTLPRLWTGSLAIAALALGLTTWAEVPRDPMIHVGAPDDRPALYAGFADGEGGPGRSFAWVEGTRAEVLLARRSRRDADLVLICQPNLSGGAPQEMSAALNGSLLGTVGLREGWQTVSMRAPAKAWQIGVNELTLSFSNAISPGQDPRKLSVAFDRVSVHTR